MKIGDISYASTLDYVKDRLAHHARLATEAARLELIQEAIEHQQLANSAMLYLGRLNT